MIFLDFETYFDKDVTLKKLSIDEYVRHPDFMVHGCGVAINDGPVEWHRNPPIGPDDEVVCHNAYFDCFILNHVYGIKPKFIYDTMCMARALYGPDKSASLKALGEALNLGIKKPELLFSLEGKREIPPDKLTTFVNDYAKPDVEIMRDAFNIMLPNFPTPELDLIDLTIRMFTEPALVLNSGLLEGHLSNVEKHRRDTILKAKWILDYYPATPVFIGVYDEFEEVRSILASNDKFADLLMRLGESVPIKKSLRTGSPTYAFSKKDVEFTNLLQHKDERIRDLVQARLTSKSLLEETRTKTYLRVSKEPFPVQLMYYGAHTGRYSGGSGEKKKGGKNPQNLTRGSEIKKAIEAPDGYVVAAADSSQIEARGIALVASQWDIVEAFANEEDIYSIFATDLFGYLVSKKTPVERYIGKTCILGLGYGMGGPKLQWTLETGQIPVKYTEDRCREIVTFYRDKYSHIVELWGLMQECINLIHRNEKRDYEYFSVDGQGIRLPNGLYIRYNRLTKEGREFKYFGRVQGRPDWVKLYGGKATENLIQALARIVITEQMAKISKRYKVVLQVHDEITCLIPEKEAEEGMEWVTEVMSTPPSWAQKWPVTCEGSYAKSYGETK